MDDSIGFPIRKRLLFVSEAVTLAQVVRLFALARAVASEHEVHFACARFDERIFAEAGFVRHALRSISPERADRLVRWGLPLYSKRTLAKYLDDDRRVIDQAKPDLIIGDLRWTLSIAGPLARVPVASLANAYWSAPGEWPLPEHPIVRLLGVKLAEEHFRKALPLAFRLFARPLDRLRELHGLAPLGSLPSILGWGDATLFADPQVLFPKVPGRFLGAIPWSPSSGAEPVPSSRPLAYVTLGSSGNWRALPAVLSGLEGFEVLLSTAGRKLRVPPHVRAEPLVRGDVAAARAAIVVCNGGASTAYQALAAGTPVVGLPMNLDQYLSMAAMERAGAGVLVRSGTATAAGVREAARRALELRPRAAEIAREMAGQDALAEFRKFVSERSASSP